MQVKLYLAITMMNAGFLPASSNDLRSSGVKGSSSDHEKLTLQNNSFKLLSLLSSLTISRFPSLLVRQIWFCLAKPQVRSSQKHMRQVKGSSHLGRFFNCFFQHAFLAMVYVGSSSIYTTRFLPEHYEVVYINPRGHFQRKNPLYVRNRKSLQAINSPQ